MNDLAAVVEREIVTREVEMNPLERGVALEPEKSTKALEPEVSGVEKLMDYIWPILMVAAIAIARFALFPVDFRQ